MRDNLGAHSPHRMTRKSLLKYELFLNNFSNALGFSIRHGCFFVSLLLFLNKHVYCDQNREKPLSFYLPYICISLPPTLSQDKDHAVQNRVPELKVFFWISLALIPGSQSNSLCSVTFHASSSIFCQFISLILSCKAHEQAPVLLPESGREHLQLRMP